MKPKKMEILELMALNEAAGAATIIFDLEEYLGYTRPTARGILSWLKKQGLVINDRRGEWVLTDRGYERLGYYREKFGGKGDGD